MANAKQSKQETSDKRTLASYDAVALQVLVFEFPFNNKEETNLTIARRLKRRKLGAFDAIRVSRLRRFKTALQKEIAKQHKSAYYRGPADEWTRNRKYVEMADWDLPKLIADLGRRHAKVPKRVLALFVPYAVACYHLL